MLNIHNLTISFNGEDLFSEITFKIDRGQRIGLIGKNGAGKSTLLKIIAGEQEYDAGSIAIDKEISIGFLKQDIDFEKGYTILEEAYKAFVVLKKLERDIEKINEKLSITQDFNSEYYHQLVQELSDLNHRFEVLGGYKYQGETERILIGLGFKREDFDKQTDTFSGGWRMRIELAKLLLQNNDILLLDEPTNHLDIESIVWFEIFLKNYSGAVILVSHDKMFLDNVTNRTIEISLGQIYDYKKPYSEYLLLRNEIKEKQLQAQKNQEKEIKQTEQLIEKFRYKASKAAFAQSLIKKLDKVERIEVDDDDNAVMNIRFPLSVQPGKVIFEVENASKNYGDKKVLSKVNMLLDRGSKIAFVGQNGQGKTTLAKMLVKEVEFQGKIQHGHNVQIGYFAQNQSDYLDGNLTVLETMENAANEHNRSKVRDMLGAFLFGGEEADKKVKVLSGGERNRLALCKMLLSPFNVLIMDEPTNHLDIASKNVLKQALINFGGTLILVSHDRDFLQGLTNKVYFFKDQKIIEYLGNINEFLSQQNFNNLREAEKKMELSVQVNSNGKDNYLQNKQSEKEIKQLKNKLNKLEKEISKLEDEIKIIENQLDKNLVDVNHDFFSKYQAKKDHLEQLMDDWTLCADLLN
ncbi:MAG: ATP-binding cassette domain-containing protein [Flavobacteriaceae bacterium]|nr:ATP-binding cassette domain-containing protein [Flavobacteriaceae bacterium]